VASLLFCGAKERKEKRNSKGRRGAFYCMGRVQGKNFQRGAGGRGLFILPSWRKRGGSLLEEGWEMTTTLHFLSLGRWAPRAEEGERAEKKKQAGRSLLLDGGGKKSRGGRRAEDS